MRGRDPETGEFLSPSRSQKRREALDVLALAERLVELPDGQLAAVALPDDLRELVRDSRRITAQIARKRQIQFLAKQMRKLDDEALAPGFDALVEYRDHKPFECVGEGRESRAAFAALARLAEWREDALIERYAREIAPQLADVPTLDSLLEPAGPHHLPPALRAALGLA